MHYTQQQGIKGVTLDDIYLGNGASELIAMATNALLDNGDELLLPAPDYPLVDGRRQPVRRHAGALPVRGGQRLDARPGGHPRARSRRAPRASWSSTRTTRPARLYSDELLQGIVAIAREHNLVIFADEVYDKVLYDGVKHTAIASLSEDVLTLTFNSLSKSYRSCGYRAGWMVVSGDKKAAADYIEGLNMLSNMRLCANVPGQWAIQTALGGYQSINELVGRGRAPAPPARPGLRADHRHSRRDLRQAARPRSTCFRGWIPRSTRSPTTASSSWSCCRKPA